MKQFIALSSFVVPSRMKQCFAVECDETYYDFEELKKAVVLIDGKKRQVIGVERTCKLGPWHKGETISLMVDD